jgi:hypothetical protein
LQDGIAARRRVESPVENKMDRMIQHLLESTHHLVVILQFIMTQKELGLNQ